MALTKIEISAMRKASVICFRHSKGQSQIEAVKKEKGNSVNNPFNGEQRLEILCDYKFSDYTEGQENRVDWDNEKDNFEAFEMFHHAQSEEIWQTVAHIFKEGDELCLHWRRGSRSTEGLKNNGFVGDDVFLILKRGEKIMTFLMDVAVTPNNSARMTHKIR